MTASFGYVSRHHTLYAYNIETCSEMFGVSCRTRLDLVGMVDIRRRVRYVVKVVVAPLLCSLTMECQECGQSGGRTTTVSYEGVSEYLNCFVHCLF